METVAYGFWPSPISPETMAQKHSGRTDLRCANGRLYWLERRADQAGRTQICSLPQMARDITAEAAEADMIQHLPDGYSAQSAVHEYGGAPYCVVGETIVFVNSKDQQIYILDAEGVRPITQQADYRFADLQWDRQYERLIAVAEIHREQSPLPENQLLALDLSGNLTVLHRGHDFYSSPRLSADGKQLVFVAWDMPNMPWDRTVLYAGKNVSEPDMSHFRALIDVAHQAPQQPTWGADGALYFVNDPEGFGQIFRLADTAAEYPGEPLFNVEGEIGLPMWVFGQQSYQVFADGSVIASVIQQGQPKLMHWSADIGTRWLERRIIDTHYLTRSDNPKHSTVFFTSAFADADDSLAVASIADCGELMIADVITTEPASYAVSVAEPITVPVGEAHTYAYYYPPANHTVRAPADTPPPLIVIGHGGPTGMTSASFNPHVQFWTSRGFAVADVNYRGSTGFGRAYRESLYGKWGVADVADAAAVADYLVAQGKANPDQLIIRGKSAGGYLVLAALAFTDTFTLGAVYYGVSDLSLLAEDTHKFEYRYLEYLLAPYPAEKALYEARSPIHHLDQLNAPVIVLQGLADKVVPPNQSEAIVAALEQKGIPVEYVSFPEEKHGFRQPENIARAFARELAFYQQHIGT